MGMVLTQDIPGFKSSLRNGVSHIVPSKSKQYFIQLREEKFDEHIQPHHNFYCRYDN